MFRNQSSNSSPTNKIIPLKTALFTCEPCPGGLESWLNHYSVSNPATAPSAATPFLSSAFARPIALPVIPSATPRPGSVLAKGIVLPATPSLPPPAPTSTSFDSTLRLSPLGSTATSRRHTNDRYNSSSSSDNLSNVISPLMGSSSDAFEASSSHITRAAGSMNKLSSCTLPTYHPNGPMQTSVSFIEKNVPPSPNPPSFGGRLELPSTSGPLNLDLEGIVPPPSALRSLPDLPAPVVVLIPKKIWYVCENLTRTHLDLCLKRLCTEIDWDFWAANFTALNLMNDPMTELTFRTIFCPAYEVLLTLHARCEVYRFIDVIGQLAEPGDSSLEEYKILVSGIIGVFADIKVGFQIGESDGAAWTEKDVKIMKDFMRALLEEGDIIKFVKARTRSAGLKYPGGVGRFEERMNIAKCQNRG